MSYLGDGEVYAVLRSAEQVASATLATATARFVAPGSITGGQFGLFRWDMTAQVGGPGPHFHRTFSESFYLLSGSVRLFDGRAWLEARPHDFLFVPQGGVHGFRNESGEPASMLILFAPGTPRENYFQELAAIAAEGRTLGPDEWTELYARHDQFMVDRPQLERRASAMVPRP